MRSQRFYFPFRKITNQLYSIRMLRFLYVIFFLFEELYRNTCSVPVVFGMFNSENETNLY